MNNPAVLLFLAAALSSCVSVAISTPAAENPLAEVDLVIGTLDSLKGKPPEAKVEVQGRNFVLDCIGTVSAAYWGARVDIKSDFPKFEGNGVLRLARSLEARGLLSVSAEPAPGDILLWENTWDRNGDGKFGNDGPTHAGIVRQTDGDGTVHYIHEDYIRGVVVAYMNLRQKGVPKSPEGKIWNSPLYMGSYPGNPKNPPRYLSSDLYLGAAPAPSVVREFFAGEGD